MPKAKSKKKSPSRPRRTTPASTTSKKVRQTAMARQAHQLSPQRRALAALGLTPDWSPQSPIAQVFSDIRITTHGLIQYLRLSPEPEAKSVVSKYDALTPVERRSVTVDHLIGSAEVDAHKIAGNICEMMSRSNALRTQVIASFGSPMVMHAAVRRAMSPIDGNADAKMVLQATGSVPVPKNSVSHVNIIGNKIENKTAVVNVPSLADVVKNIDTVVSEVTLLPPPARE